MRAGSPRHSCGRIGSERSQERGLKGDAETGYERLLRSPPATTCTVVQLRPGGLAAPLFLFPDVGCELNELHHLVRNPPGRTIYGLQIDFPSTDLRWPQLSRKCRCRRSPRSRRSSQLALNTCRLFIWRIGCFAASQLICQAGGEVGF